MRILILYPGPLADTKRGTPLRARSLTRFLAERETVHIMAIDVPSEWTTVGTQLPASHIPVWGWYVRMRALLRTCRTFHPDIIYGQTHGSLPLLFAARMCGYVTCVDLHGDPLAERGIYGLRRWLLHKVDNLLLRHLHGATVVQSQLHNLYPTNTSFHWHVLHGGVDMAQITQITPAPLETSTRPIIFYGGNMNPYQGVELLFAALHTLRAESWTLLFVCSSDGEYARSLLRQYDIADRVLLKTALPQSEVFALLRASDIAVVPRPDTKITRIAFPSKLPEYLASGAAVISTNVGDAFRLVRDGDTGWLIQPGSTEDLSRALLDAMYHPEKRKRCARHAQALMREQYDWPRLVADLLIFFHTLIHESYGTHGQTESVR